MLSFLFYIVTFAQKKQKDIHRLQLNLSFDIYDKVNVAVEQVEVLKGRYSPSGKFGLNYSYYFKDIVGINMGLAFTIVPHRFGVEHPTAYAITIFGDSIPNPDYYDFYKHYVYSIPISVEKRFQLSKKHFLSAQLGTEINFILNYPYSISIGGSTGGSATGSYRVFEYSLHQSKSPVIAAFFFKIGYYKQLIKGNTLGFNFKLNYSPQFLGEGSYKWSNLAYESYGDLKWDINHLGIEMVYGFLPIKNKKKLKKESEIEKF